MSRRAAEYHNPSPHSLTKMILAVFIFTAVSMPAMASCLDSAVAHEPGPSPGNITGLIIILLSTIKFSTASSCRTMIIGTDKLVIVKSISTLSLVVIIFVNRFD
jgi:hypothetical protein